MRVTRLPLRWVGPGIPGLAEALAPWHGTPYRADSQCAGVGVDCVRFVAAVSDAITGNVTKVEHLPQDTGMNQPDVARAAMRRLLENYRPYRHVTNGQVEGGDILVVGPIDGGPTHAMVVGPEPNTIWHATSPRVAIKGMTLRSDWKVFKVYRHEL